MTSLTEDYDVPIIMLITEFKFDPDDTGEIFGFWYFQATQLPAPKTAEDGFLPDLLQERCCQLRLRGRMEQIAAIIRSSENDVAKTTDFSVLHKGVTVGLEDVAFSKGTSWGVDVSIRTTETRETVMNKLRSRRDVVELIIAPDWSLDEDLMQFFKSA